MKLLCEEGIYLTDNFELIGGNTTIISKSRKNDNVDSSDDTADMPK